MPMHMSLKLNQKYSYELWGFLKEEVYSHQLSTGQSQWAYWN